MNRKQPVMAALSIMVITLGLGHLAAQAPASPDNPLQLKPDHATISVADLNKEATWYVQVLGFKEAARIKRGDDFEHVELRLATVYRIDLTWQKGSARHIGPPSDTEQGWRHIVFTTPNLDNTLQWLESKKADMRVDRDEKTHAINQIFVRDPEGNEIELQHQ